MVVRSHLNVLVTDTAGTVRQNTVVTITKKTGAALAQSVYAAESGGSALPSFTTDSLGRLSLFADTPERVLVTPSGGTAFVEEFFPEPSEITRESITVPVNLDGYASNDDWALTVQNTGTQSKAFRVLNDGGDAILQVWQDTTGVNDLVSINLLDASRPTTSLLHVARAITVTGFSVGRFVAQVTAAVSGTAITGEASQSVAGAGSATAGAFTATRSTPASAGITRGAVATIASQVLGTGTSNTGFHATSAAHSGGSSVRNDVAFLADGAAGWNYGWMMIDTNASTILGSLSQTGVLYSVAVSSGAAPATTGEIRLSNLGAIYGRNVLNNADIRLLTLDATNNVLLGVGTGSVSTYVLATTAVAFQVGAVIQGQATTGGMIVGSAAGTVGFYASAGVAKSAALVQTYSTADRTHANATSATLTDSSGGSASATIAAITGGGAGCENATKNAIASLAAQVNALRVDLLDAKQFLNSVVDDLQAVNLVG